jgi:hypothetical protein
MEKERINEFTSFIKDCGPDVWAKITDYQTEFKKYLDEEDFAKILAMVKQINSKYNVRSGADLISFYEMVSSTPLSQMRSTETLVHNKLLESLLYRFTPNAPDKQIIVLSQKGMTFDECKNLADVVIGNKLTTEKRTVFPFLVSENHTCYGRITHKATGKTPYNLVSIFIKNTKTGPEQRLSFLGDSKELYNAEKYIDYLYTYYFTTVNAEKPEEIMEYTLLSLDPLPVEDIELKGMLIPIIDNIKVGSNAKIIKGTEILFVTSYKKIVNDMDDSQFDRLIVSYQNNFSRLYSEYFGQFRHPPIFEKFLMAWLFSSERSYGPMNEYKPNLGIIGPSRSGKSMLADCLKIVFRETKHGESTTIKGLIPSFGGNRPAAGAFLKAKRFCIFEEFISTIMKNNDPLATDLLKSLLVHDDVSSVSGKFDGVSIAGKPTGTFVFVANFQKPKMNNFVDFANLISPSFLARFLIYVQTEEHKEFVKERQKLFAVTKSDDNKEFYPKYAPYKIELYDYLLRKKIDFGGFNEFDIIDKYKKLLPDNANIREMYNGANEHLVRLIDGITKVNYIVEGRTGPIKVTQKDFTEMDEIWGFLINSWSGNITQMDTKHKLQHLTQKQKVVYNLIKDTPGITRTAIYEELAEILPNEIDTLMKYNLITINKLGSVENYVIRDKSILDVKVEGYND